MPAYIVRTALTALLLSFALVGCAAPTPTAVPLRATAAPTASPSSTLLPTHTATRTPSPAPTASRVTATATARPPTATVRLATATPAPASPTATAPLPATRIPSLTPSATSTVAVWRLSHLLVGPGQPGRLYAHQSLRRVDTKERLSERLLISDDSGQSWYSYPWGLPFAHVSDLTMDYARQDALYAATDKGLYALVEGNWVLLNPDITRAISVAYGDPNTLWSLLRGGSDDAYGSLLDYVVKSTDGGRTWNAAEFGTYGSLLGVAINPDKPDEVYVLSAYKTWGYEFYRYHAGVWERLSSPVRNTDGYPVGLMAPMFGGWTIDGATGALYVAFSREVLSDPSAMCCWAQEIWRTTNTASENVDEIGWELVQDFGTSGAVSLVSSGWTSQGLALYALWAEIAPEQRCDCDMDSSFALYVSHDSGYTWQPLPLPDMAD